MSEADASSEFNIRVKVDPTEASHGLEEVHGALEGIEGLIAKIGLAVGFAELAHKGFELAESYEAVQNRLRVITKSEEELTDVTHQLFLVSEQTRASVQGTTEIYARLARASAGLNISQHDLLEVTRSLNEAALISGKSTESLSGVVGQLAIGLQTGTLNGRALRLILRDFPDIADALSKQLGVTSQEFKKLGAEGKISAQDLLGALVGAREELDGKFGRVVPTVGQELGVFNTKLTEFFGHMNEGIHVTEGFAKAVAFLGDHIPAVVGTVGLLSGAIAFELAAKAIPAAVAALGTFDTAIIATVGPLAAVAGAAVTVGIKVGELADDIKQAYEDVGGLKQLTDFGQEGANIELLKTKIKNLQEVIARNPDNEIAKRNLEGYREDLAKLTEEHKKVADAAKVSGRAQVDASASVIEDLERQLKLLQLTTHEREIAAKAYELEKAAQATTGSGFTDAQRAEVKTRLEKISTLTDEDKLLDELRGPQQAYNLRVKEATDLLQKEKITLAEYYALIDKKDGEKQGPEVAPPITTKIDTGASQFLFQLQREREEIGLTNQQKQLRIELDKAAASAGRPLHDDEIAYLTKEIELNQSLEESEKARAAAEAQTASLRKEIFEEIRGPQEHILGLQTQLNVLYHDGALSVEEYQRALLKLNIAAHQLDTTFEGGVSVGLSKIQLQLDDLSQLGEKTITDAFAGATDALVGFVTTGKLSFSSLISSIQQDLAKLLVQQLEKGLFGSLFGNLSGSGPKGEEGLLGSLFGGGAGAASGGIGDFFSGIGSFFGGLFAEGGDPPVDKPIIVGEKGPELLMLKHPGTIVPNSQSKQLLSGAAGSGSKQNVTVAPPQVHLNVTNQIDSKAIVTNGLRSREGEQEVLNIIARNRQAVRSNLT